MKRIYTVLSVFFLLFAMLMGLLSTFDKDATYSEAEKRKLKTKPKMTHTSAPAAVPTASPTLSFSLSCVSFSPRTNVFESRAQTSAAAVRIRAMTRKTICLVFIKCGSFRFGDTPPVPAVGDFCYHYSTPGGKSQTT